MNNKKVKIHFVDFLIVLLNIAAGRGNYLLYWLLHVTKGTWVVAFVIIIDFIYLLIRFSNKSGKFNFWESKPIIIILFLLLYNVFNIYLHGGSAVYLLEILFVDFLFYTILIKLTSLFDKSETLDNRISCVAKGYIWISFISIFGIFVSFLLLTLGYNNDIPIEADFLEVNAEDGIYVRSFFSVNYILYSIRMPFFQDYGYLCGLFHEPHTLTYGVFPCLILLLGLVKDITYRIGIIFMGILVVFFSVSATNILASFACLFVFLLLKLRHHFISVMVSSFFLATLIIYYFYLDDTILQFVVERLDSDNTSQQASKDLMLFAFTPQTLMGTDFLATSFVKNGIRNQDIGFIAFFMYIFFLFFYIRNTIQLFFKKDSLSIAVGLASLYLIIHSLKIGMSMFIQTTPILLIFLQTLVLKEYGRITFVKKNR